MLRFVARSLLGWTLISGGAASVKTPGPRPQVVQKAAKGVGVVLDDAQAESLVKLNGAVMAGAGATFALGIAPRLSALALIGALVPTTLAGHAYWEMDDPQARAQHKTHFMKNVSIVGGLLLALTLGGRRRDDAA